MSARAFSQAALSLAIGLVLVSCDRPKGAPASFPSPTDLPAPTTAVETQTPPPVRHARSERAPEPITFDETSGVYTLGGRFLPVAHLWRFRNSTEQFSGVGAELKPAADGGLEVSVSAPDAIIRSPQALKISGERYNAVLVRLTRLRDSGKWDGALFYTTAGHPESSTYFARPIRGADPAPGETTLMVYDMRRLRKGGEDWSVSTIQGLRLDLDDTPGGVFHIQEIAVVALPKAQP